MTSKAAVYARIERIALALLIFSAAQIPQAHSQRRLERSHPALPSAYGFREIIDTGTGVKLSLPLGILGPPKASGLGNNWSSASGRLKIATLNFRGKKTLRSIYDAIRGRPGRTLTADKFGGNRFFIQGTDQDGSVVYVQAEKRGGEVRGLSITLEKGAGAELTAAVQAIVPSIQAFPPSEGQTAVAGVPPPSPTSPQVSCDAGIAGLSQLASGVRFAIAAPPEIQAGGKLEFSWQAPERFPPETPLYLILAVSGEAAFEVPPEPKPQAPAEGVDLEPEAAHLPGFMALRPPSAGPKGIGFGSGMTRAFIPLHQAGSHLQGAFSVRLFDAGKFDLKAAAVASTACGERVLKSEPPRLVNVVPAQPEIVVQDPYDIEQPKQAILSNSGRYLLQVFDSRYRVFDAATGAKLVDRAGHNPNFSPTSRFVVANTGVSGGENYEAIDLISRQRIGSIAGPLIGWTESDAFLMTAGAGDWSSIAVRPTLLQDPTEADEDSFSLAMASPIKTSPSWEILGVKLDVDAGIVTFANEAKPVPGIDEAAKAYELASGQSLPPMPIEKGWHAREQIRFSHFYDPAADKTNYHEWVKERAKSKTLKDLRPYQIAHRTLDQASELLRNLANLRYAGGDWRAAKSRGEAFGDANRAGFDNFLKELERFGISIAAEVPREAIAPIVSPIEAEKRELQGVMQAEPETTRIRQAARALEDRLVREVPAAKQLLDSEALSLGDKINLGRHLEGLWRWEIEGTPIWMLEAMDFQGSGVFGFIQTKLLNGKGSGGAVSELPEDILGGYAPHPNQSSDGAVRLKPRIFLNRYLVAGLAGAKTIAVIDLRGEQNGVVLKDIPQADLLADVLLTADGRHVIQVNSDGQFFFHDVASGKMVLGGRYIDAELIFYTPEGYYWSSYEGAHFVQLRFPGLPQLYSFQQFASVLDRPDMVKKQLDKAAPELPQPALTPPPDLDIELVQGPETNAADRIRVHTRSSVGLASLRFYYDGQPVHDEPLSGSEFQGEVKIPRSRHARWLTALAIDAKGFVSAAQALRLKPQGGGTNRLLGVVAGVDRYADPSIDLTYAKSDASRLAAALKARGTSYYAAQDIELLLDNAATGQSISETLEKAAASATPEDTILFFFAGHGAQGEDGRYYLIPSNIDLNSIEKTGLPWARIAAALGRTKARAIVILDACHSGLSGAEGLATNDDAVKGLLSGSRAPLVVLAASKGRQLSFEGRDWQGGVFTYALTKVLKEGSPSAGGAKEPIDVSGLYRKLREIVSRDTKGQQTPWLARQDLIGDFPLF